MCVWGDTIPYRFFPIFASLVVSLLTTANEQRRNGNGAQQWPSRITESFDNM